MTDERRQASRGPSRLWPFKGRDDIITVVDLGAQKVACAVVLLTSPRFGFDVGARNIRVIGSAVVRSSGISGGRIANLAAIETSIRRAVGQAETQAGVTVEDVLVTGQFSGLVAEVFEARLGHAGLVREDVEAISAAADEHCARTQRKLLHLFTSSGESDAEAAFASQASGAETDVIAISIPLRVQRQLGTSFGKSLLNVRSLLAGPLASGLSVTNALERMSGVLVIDMGAQTTGVVLFQRGVPVFLECLNFGGQTVSEEIAQVFSLRKFEAERLKVRYGSVYDNLQADIDLPVQNGDTGEPVSKFSLNRIIRSRASEHLEAVNERLKGAGYSVPNGGAVLTGGGSFLPGIRELASHLFAAEVRTAKPMTLSGLNAGNVLSALVGGCLYASRHQSAGEMPYAPELPSQDSSYASRIGQWLRTSFS
ncbi:rod shape-determining protein [Rhodomicrobium sp. Az07]|uniref:cell division protein FtsA n=1 Tax=Rhodomicrobium sp. Az07 TaxID=2839034 RepID=UPI001BE562B5|nr:cell division FtsA domain-containing protein [Rhodomicrobium sp. Az07]MBT3071731.1 rod shape-determining protein [Rhodomicrobium sp. Az07]